MPEDTWTSSSDATVLCRELGERIRSSRTDAGLEITDVAVRTRIGSRYLNALEEGRWEDLPGPVFIKGFIRSICAELQRDPYPFLEIVDQIHLETQPEEAESPNGTRRVAPLILSGLLLAALVTGGVLLHGGKEEQVEQAAVPAISAGDSGVGGSAEEYGEEQAVVELDLLLRATEKTWLRIQADASEPWETTMKTGDEIRLKAVERVTLFIGNAGGILFELNGRRFGPLGTQGQVISNYVITRDNL